jgi:hypothetical protein
MEKALLWYIKKMMPSGTTLLKRNSQKKYQILIDDAVSNYLRNQLSDTGERDRKPCSF